VLHKTTREDRRGRTKKTGEVGQSCHLSMKEKERRKFESQVGKEGSSANVDDDTTIHSHGTIQVVVSTPSAYIKLAFVSPPTCS